MQIELLRHTESVMSHTSCAQAGNAGVSVVPTTTALAQDPSLQAFWALRVGFTIAPILAGLDKFFHWFVDWDQYVAPGIADLVGGNAHAFMLVVGVVEIVAGIGVAIRPRIFAYVVSAWLLGIIATVLMLLACLAIAAVIAIGVASSGGY